MLLDFLDKCQFLKKCNVHDDQESKDKQNGNPILNYELFHIAVAPINHNVSSSLSNLHIRKNAC